MSVYLTFSAPVKSDNRLFALIVKRERRSQSDLICLIGCLNRLAQSTMTRSNGCVVG